MNDDNRIGGFGVILLILFCWWLWTDHQKQVAREARWTEAADQADELQARVTTIEERLGY